MAVTNETCLGNGTLGSLTKALDIGGNHKMK